MNSTSGGIVNVHNEWDPLEEVIIGVVDHARVPRPGPDLLAVDFPHLADELAIPTGPYPNLLLEETARDLDALCDTLRSLGVVVRRPQADDLGVPFSSPHWETEGYYNYCPRDVLLTIGDLIIEAPMVLRSRQYEAHSYRRLLVEYLDAGARWVTAPRPQLLDDMYDTAAPEGRRLQNHEPAFDAANVLRFDRDIVYLVSDTGNERGARWLQSALGPDYRVHLCRGLYSGSHVDTTIVPLRPGLLLVNPERVTQTNLPSFLESWDKVACPEMVETGFVGDQGHGSAWVGMNLLVVRPGLAIVDDRQTALLKTLESNGVEVIPQRLTHSRSLGGSFHCVSLDVRRAGELASH